MNQPEQALLVFAREPVPGQVKTRLIPELGVARATQIYDQLLNHTLEVASGVPACAVVLWCDAPLGTSPQCSVLAERFRYPLLLQEGDDLGVRMSAAITHALCQYERAVVIGTDCPQYNQDYLSQALSALDRYDVVLGPATDGGYVLIGMSRPQPELFLDVPWGTERVLEMTRQRLRQLNCSWFEMPVLRDVDRPEDLEYYKDFFYEALNEELV
jgi:rSAM/selenodomain-associated transferase 1